MSKNFWSSDKLLSLSALLVSLCTLMVFAYQTNLVRKQQYMSVYPHLDLYNSYSGSLNYQYTLKNNGVGPAFTRAIKVKELNGKTYKSLLDLVGNKLTEKDSLSLHYSDLYEGQLVTANQEIILFGLWNEEEAALRGDPPNTLKGARRLRDILNNDSIRVEIRYESIYGESWSTFSDLHIPVKH